VGNKRSKIETEQWVVEIAINEGSLGLFRNTLKFNKLYGLAYNEFAKPDLREVQMYEGNEHGGSTADRIPVAELLGMGGDILQLIRVKQGPKLPLATGALTALFFSLRFHDQTDTGRIRWDPPIQAAPARSVRYCFYEQ
jgi:hypothetical protein